jgi:hypothetical protein
MEPDTFHKMKIKRLLDSEKRREETSQQQLEEKERKHKKASQLLVRQLTHL